MGTIIRLTDYSPHAKQLAFHADESRIRLLRGAWRSGKTHALLWECVHAAIRTAERAGPGATFALFRRTGPALTDTMKRDFFDIIPPELIVPGSVRRQEGRVECTIVGGTRVIMRSLDDWRKQGGASYDWIGADEAWELQAIDFDQLKGRLSGKWGPRRMVLATNPPTRNHWLYKRFVEDPQPNMREHVFTTYDNAKNLPVDYLEELEGMDEARKRRFVYGEWGFTSDNTPVYPEFKESTHAALLEARRGLDYFLNTGWDFGYRHPAVIFGQILPTGHVNYLREMMGTNEDIRMFARRFKMLSETHYPGMPILHYVDIAGRSKNDLGTSSVLELRKQGIVPRYRKLALMRTINGMRNLMSTIHLGRPLLQVDRRYCPQLVEAFGGGYGMDPDTDEPCKDGFFDHGADAARYLAAPLLLGLTGMKASEPPPRNRQRVAV